MRSLFTSSRVWLAAILTAAPFALSAQTLAATERTIPVSFSPHTNSTSLIELNRGRNDGLRLGDRGAISIPGFEAEKDTSFKTTEVPLVIEELFDDRAIARIPSNLPALQPISARVTILELEPSDFGPESQTEASIANTESTSIEDAENPVTTPPHISESTPEESAIASHEAPEAIAETPDAIPEADSTEDGWIDIEQVTLERTVVLPEEICDRSNPTPSSKSPSAHPCLHASDEDTIARAILAGRDPQFFSPREAAGTMSLYSDDEVLKNAIAYYLRYPERPQAALAIGQAYLRYEQPVQAAFWLEGIKDDGADSSFSEALTHTRAYAAYRNGFYKRAIALGETLANPTTDQTILIAAAHFRRGNYPRVIELLDVLPSVPEVVNNRAIALQAMDRDLEVACEVEQVGSLERCRTDASDVETQRQDRARTLLKAIAPQSPTAQYNLAVLDLRTNDFEAAHEQIAALHADIADVTAATELDAEAIALKRATLWYVNNYQDNVTYLRTTAFPHADFGYNGATLNTFGQLLQTGFHPLALGNVIFLAVSDAQHSSQVKRVTTKLRANFLRQLDFIPAVNPPDPVNINAYEMFLESSRS